MNNRESQISIYRSSSDIEGFLTAYGIDPTRGEVKSIERARLEAL